MPEPSVMLNQRQFEDELLVAPMPDGRRWRVVTACHYETDGGARIEIPEGFITDFASIPRGLWNILPPQHAHVGKAGVIHDWLYRYRSTGTGDECAVPARSSEDNPFRERQG